jgi:cytochrome c peroxidase
MRTGLTIKKSGWALGAFLVTGSLLVNAGSWPGDPIPEREPYTPVCPSYFGNRIYISTVTPWTKEGVALGRLLFYEPRLSSNGRISCASWHQQKLAFTDGRISSLGVDQVLTNPNNGLDSLPKDPGRENVTGLPADRGRFRVPTLRNIALTAPYMHDGRFKNLEEVVDHYNDHIRESASLSPLLRSNSNKEAGRSLELSSREKENIIHFLHTLTDSTFISDPRYSDPHIPADVYGESKPAIK